MKSETPSKKERTRIIILSLSIIILFLYLALRDNSISNADLSIIKVTLTDTPKYTVNRVKGTTYRHIVLTTREYGKEFRISEMTYEATDHKRLKQAVFAGDTVELKVKSEDTSTLQVKTLINNYNDVYGLLKKEQNFVDLDLRTKLKNKDSKWAYCFVFFGLVMLPYGFIKRKPKISMANALVVSSVIGLIIILTLRKC